MQLREEIFCFQILPLSSNRTVTLAELTFTRDVSTRQVTMTSDSGDVRFNVETMSWVEELVKKVGYSKTEANPRNRFTSCTLYR